MKRKLLTLSVLAVASVAFVAPAPSHAASVTWTSPTVNKTFYFCSSYFTDGTSYWKLALQNPTFNVTYNAQIFTESGKLLNVGDPVNQGQSIILKFQSHQNSDISWFATGYSMSCPYGEWNSGVPQVTCDKDDYVSQIGNYLVYVKATVVPPVQSLSNLSGLSCGALATNADGSMQATCTVTGKMPSNNISLDFVFNATAGNLYFGYRGLPFINTSHDKCYTTNGIPLAIDIPEKAYYISSDPYSYEYILYVRPPLPAGYKISVDKQTIHYTLTVVAPPPPPTAPTVTCPASVIVGQSASYTVTGTDPSGLQVRYGMDWTGSANTPNEWVPSSGYVNSGTAETIAHAWPAAGTYTVRALTENASSADSGWSPACTTVVKAAPTGSVNSQSCVVAANASTCSMLVNWTSANTTGTVTVKRPYDSNNSIFETGVSGSKVALFSPGTFELDLYDGSNMLAFGTFAATCAAGTSWNGNICAVNPCSNGANNPPACTFFPPCTNGASNPPTCTTYTPCTNGANNPPTCTIFSPCANGASNPPTCTAFNAPSVSISANPAKVTSGSSSVLKWSSSGADSCNVTGTNGFSSAATSASSQDSGPITKQTTFTISCTNAAGPSSASVVVKIKPQFIEF